MRVSSTTTIRSGPEANFDAVARDLRAHYPNFCSFLKYLENPETLRRETRWRHHVLHQLTFSYLKPDYLVRTVRSVLDSFPSEHDAPVFHDLREELGKIVSGAIVLDETAVAVLNDLAIGVIDWINDNRISIIESSMNILGRCLFSAHSRSKCRRIEQNIAYLAIALEHHMSIDVFCRGLRETLSFHGYENSTALKEQCLRVLETFRDNLLTVETARCVFVCPDIAMYVTSLNLLDVQLYSWESGGLQDFLSEQAKEKLMTFKEKTPWTAYLTVKATCHPQSLSAAVDTAVERIQQISGFFASLDVETYHPPKKYAGVCFLPGKPIKNVWGPSGKPQHSKLRITEDRAQYLENLYRDYLVPALSTPVERNLQERLRRTLRGFRKASFSAGSHEWSQAYSAAWQTYEVVFGGTETRDRGQSISRRVAALSVGPDALRSDDHFEVSDSDFVEFCEAWKRGEVSGLADQNLHEVIHNTIQNGASPEEIRFVLGGFGTDFIDILLDWKERQVQETLEQVPAEQTRTAILARREEVRIRFEECYKLRNDIVHAGYDNDAVAEEVYKEISSLFSSFVINLAFNCTQKLTYTALLKALDDEWRGPASHEESIRKRAHALWQERGEPKGDDWRDWFQAKKEQNAGNNN